MAVQRLSDSFTVVALQDGEKGKDAAQVVFNPPMLFYQADNAGAAKATTSYTINFQLMVAGTVITPSSTPNVSFYGGTTTGASLLQPSTSAFGVSITANSSPVCQVLVSVSGVKDGITYTALGYLPILPAREGAQGGSVSSLSKMYYYAGEYNSTVTYYLRETQAPYVSIYNSSTKKTDFYMLDNKANGGATGGWQGHTPTDDGNPWTKMYSEQLYYIAQAMFADFAKLGSAIFNKDFMLSQHGILRGYGDIELEADYGTYYKYADANNMLAEISSYKVNDTTERTVSNSSYGTTSSHRASIGTLTGGKVYLVRINTTVVDRTLSLEIRNQSDQVVTRVPDCPTGNFVIIVECEVTGTHRLYWKWSGSGSTNPKIHSFISTEAAFRPNVFIDFLQGFLFANKGYFKDVTVEGRINNLITVIDWDNNVGRDKIIEAYVNAQGDWDVNNPYVSHGEYTNIAYYLDILNCGDFIYVKSLPAYGSAGGSNYVYYRMPYYATDFLQDRGHTRDTDGTPHKMTPDELRKLIGRNITLRIETSAQNPSTTYITGLLRLDTPKFYDINHLEHGRKYFITPQQSGTKHYYELEDLSCVNQVIHFQFDQVVWFAPTAVGNPTASEGYGYVWTGQLSLPGDAGMIDNFGWL